MASEDRIIGCIVGGALGDALGGPYEGMTGPVTLKPDSPYFISDDTQLTLATCEAISECGNVSPEQIAARFVAWFRERRIRGIGASTLQALTTLLHGGHWALSGRKGEMGAGNGAAMRVAPLAFCLNPHLEADRHLIRDVSRITHHSDEAYAGALAMVLAIQTSAQAMSDEPLVSIVARGIPDTVVRDRLYEFAKADPQTPLLDLARRFGCSGYVAESVPFAIYCSQFAEATPFEHLLANVISVGGDTDTIASMVGQVVGARLGYTRLPQVLLNDLQELSFVTSIAQKFAARIAG
jgi:ADP-ribosylglycohydrolase